MAVYQIKLTTLSPLHIGDGNELKQDFDFVTHGKQTYRLNEDAVLQSKESQLKPGRDGRYPVPGKLLNEADFENMSLFRYILHGVPRSTKIDARLKSFIKDVYDRPYIPGSSLKGALRTALAWNGWNESNPDLNTIGKNRSWAGQPLERKIFGNDPNHDLLRTLHVSDLAGSDEAGGNLWVINAQVLTKKSAGSPIELEAIHGDVTFSGTMTIDETLFNPMADEELHFARHKHWLDELMVRTQKHSHARIHDLVEWFEHAEHTEEIATFYHKLSKATLTSNQALMQLGWGSGWDGKTFWTHLQADKDNFERIVRNFRLHKAAPNSPPRRPGDPFPRSKRAAMDVKDGVAQAAAPFGWVLLEVSER